MKKIWIALVIIVMSLMVACTSQKNAENTQNNESEAPQGEVIAMTGDELVTLLADESQAGEILLVDVRQPEEFASGHIDSAINIPLGEVESQLETFEAFKDKKIILYCNTGNRSGQAAQLLVNNGFEKIYNADGVKQFEYELIK
ncbi:MAG: rhodanese-like domain-containing protein [Peptostreptococcaceae bacterium]|nr:rhodanese-like domain-containing protein [Peptostreptococcaceae bacterium]